MPAFTALQALHMAMEIEKNGKVFYEAAAVQAADPALKALFRELAVQEQKHYQVFERMAKFVHEPAETQPVEQSDYQLYLAATLDNALFAGPDKALAVAEGAADRGAALRAAIGFEKDTLLFFCELREMVDESDRDAVSGIISEEKAHLQRLAKAL